MVTDVDVERTVRTADGRTFAFRDFGPREAPAVIFHPGFMACRLTGRPAAGVRVISVDRPGIGNSDPAPQRSLMDAAADVATIADQLGIDRFAVLGHSAGAPSAMACAAALG